MLQLTSAMCYNPLCLLIWSMNRCVQDIWYVAPEKGNAQSFSALRSVAARLKEAEAGLLTRFVPRANGEVTLGYITANDTLENSHGCMIMSQLPYEADVRDASFTTFSKKPEVLPTKQQLVAMDTVLSSFSMSKLIQTSSLPSFMLYLLRSPAACARRCRSLLSTVSWM